MLAVCVVVAILIAVAFGARLLAQRAAIKASPDLWFVTQLQRAGSNLSRPHDVEFFLYFPNEAGARRIADEISTKGFAVSVAPSASGQPQWLALARRSMIPEVEELVRLRAMFQQIAATEHGSYDGWGAPVVRQE